MNAHPEDVHNELYYYVKGDLYGVVAPPVLGQPMMTSYRFLTSDSDGVEPRPARSVGSQMWVAYGQEMGETKLVPLVWPRN